MTSQAIQTMLVYTEANDKPYVMYATAEEVLSILNQPGVVKYNGEAVGRADGPAVRFDEGMEFWFRHGEKVKAEMKTIVDNGNVWHLENSILHRIGSPAYEGADGTVAHYEDGVLHNGTGPAVILADGTKEWFFKGKRHRKDGPAVEFASGRLAWFIEGERVSKVVYEEWLKSQQPSQESSLGWGLPLLGLVAAGIIGLTAKNEKIKTVPQEVETIT